MHLTTFNHCPLHNTKYNIFPFFFLLLTHTCFFPKSTLLTTSNLKSYKGMMHNPLPQRINKEPKKDIHHIRVESLSSQISLKPPKYLYINHFHISQLREIHPSLIHLDQLTYMTSPPSKQKTVSKYLSLVIKQLLKCPFK